MSARLTNNQVTTLRFIGEEPRPCQCQFREDDLAWLGAYGLIAINDCLGRSHGSITITPAGREALKGQDR